MKEHNLEGLDLKIFHKELSNGLNIYVMPKKTVNNTYVTFSTKYGSIHNTFIPHGKNKMITVNDGIAHFLEHKVFEQPDGKDPFSVFANHGADANANTSNYKTTYLFSGPEFFKENMNYLLDFVQTPYFTDENVEKEKGIIIEELKMYSDQPYYRLYEESLFNAFVNHPIRYSVGGSIESVSKITKDELYECYNTFYHPSNMYVVITGNIEPNEAIKIIEENQASKNYSKMQNIKTKIPTEPNKVLNKNLELNMDVIVPKVSYNYKINYSHLNKINKYVLLAYFTIWFYSKFSNTSIIEEELKNKGIISDSLELSYNFTDEHVLFMIMADVLKEKELDIEIKKAFKDSKISMEDFDRKKKVLISFLVSLTDDIYKINEKLMGDIAIYNHIHLNDIEIIKNLSYDELEKIISSINFDNYNIVRIKPKA
jgi:predicted Zn-dependent peptidase